MEFHELSKGSLVGRYFGKNDVVNEAMPQEDYIDNTKPSYDELLTIATQVETI